MIGIELIRGVINRGTRCREFTSVGLRMRIYALPFFNDNFCVDATATLSALAWSSCESLPNAC